MSLMALSLKQIANLVRNSRRLARKLVDRGIAEERSGNASKALSYYRRAVETDANCAPAHMNLGIALQASGELNAAIASYKRAIAVDRAYTGAHYNLARAYLLSSDYSQAEKEFQITLQLHNEFPEAWVGLAGAQEGLGRDEDALAALESAIALRSDYVGALFNSIALLRKMGRFEIAAANCCRVLELEPENHFAHRMLGMSLHALGQLTEAEASYRHALILDPRYSDAKANLASILQTKGRVQEAIPLLFDLVADEPGNMQLRRNLAYTLNGLQLAGVGEKERSVLLSLCKDNVSTQFLIVSIIALLKSERGFQILLENARRGQDVFTPLVPGVAQFLSEPLLLEALPRMPIADAGVEQVLSHVRRCILRRIELTPTLKTPDEEVPTEFALALARQCFFSGYAWFAHEDELKIAGKLRDVLQDTLREGIVTPHALESALTVASFYDSLHTLEGFGRVAERTMADWSEGFRAMVREQIENPNREREIAGGLKSLTTIDNGVSLAVRAQYEENPYPRWVTVASPNTDTIEKLVSRLRPGEEVRLRPRPVPVLIAGCGTGRHSIQVARAYPDSEILAVDLSVTSLAYAARMTEQLGIANITYRQADILKLGELDRSFALVECSGVLHHLDDPNAGWRVLVDLLESDGVMKIGLYSKKARIGVQAAREFAQSLRAPATRDGIRRCRDAIIGLPEGHPARDVMALNDFYTLDGCRDLIMHVQEHQFTIPSVRTCLEKLDLQFLQFETTPTTLNRFKEMFPDENSERELTAWQQFEDFYPNTFIGMYVFWCCRKQSNVS
jgi:tetratricopeptide (TPR) repeat protein/SAM-dependent methyltransferase